MVFSALMSSSGALGIITITAVGGGIISFPASVAIMM
jgi:Na+/phosphate symporter